MEIRSFYKKLPQFFHKYKYVGLVLLIGIVLMLLPTGSDKNTTTGAQQVQNVQQEPSVEEQLAAVLRQTKGVGEVKVLLTKGEGEETLYQTDTEMSSGEADRSSTVTVTDAERNQTGLVRQVNPPTYLGAVVVCQGADDPQVRLAVVDAVSKATGLKANCISVLKMK